MVSASFSRPCPVTGSHAAAIRVAVLTSRAFPTRNTPYYTLHVPKPAASPGPPPRPWRAGRSSRPAMFIVFRLLSVRHCVYVCGPAAVRRVGLKLTSYSPWPRPLRDVRRRGDLTAFRVFLRPPSPLPQDISDSQRPACYGRRPYCYISLIVLQYTRFFAYWKPRPKTKYVYRIAHWHRLWGIVFIDIRWKTLTKNWVKRKRDFYKTDYRNKPRIQLYRIE